jgi:large subunit ribosomal protein L4
VFAPKPRSYRFTVNKKVRRLAMKSAFSVKASANEIVVVDSIALAESVFGIEPNEAVMHQMVLNYLAAQRQGTQSALTRSEVSGGGKKPWRQKGTGRARQGSTRSPQWTHGGIVFAPKPRSYRFTVNKKERRLAMKSAFSVKAAANEIIVVDTIAVDEYKTKKVVAMLKAIEADKKALIVLDSVDNKMIKSANNIPGVKTAQVNTLNVYDILNHDAFIVSKGAVAKIEEVYAK